MKIRYLGQSGFILETDFSTLLIDPPKRQDGEVDGQLVYCTHKHSDHTSGIAPFMKRNADAILVCNAQVASKFMEFNDRTVVINADKTFHKTPWSFRFIEGTHGMMKGIENTGVVISDTDSSFGHPGDTTTLAGFYQREVDYLAVPISGAVTASPKKIIEELAFFKRYPQVVIPMHWLVRKPKTFCKKLRVRFPEIQCIVPEKGKYVME